MKLALIVSPEAQLDARRAAAWYDGERPGLGNEFNEQLLRLLDRIAENPLQFPVLKRGFRRALMNRFPYSVYFRVDETSIAVVAVIHQHRRPDIWERRL